MNYITSCPQCDTQFLISDELIEAFQGDVQCGSCEHVFNTADRLTGVSDDIHSAEEYQASLEQDGDDDEEISYETSHADDHALFEDEIKNEPTFDVETPSFIQDQLKEETKTKKSKAGHPVLFGFFALLLMLAAALQTIYYKRVAIAAQYPQFKPMLIKACQPLKCSVDLPKELDFITIGSSDMQENDSYESVINFTSSFRNTANYAQAYPNIELTLTNEADKVVIKKLIKPADYLAKDIKVNRGIPGRDVVDIKLSLYVHEAVVAGYRMLLVY